MRAYLIDPNECTVTEVDYNGDFHQIYELIEAGAFDLAPLSEGDAVYVDDTGLFKPDLRVFRIEDHMLAGKGLVLGTDDEGESTEPCISLEELRHNVRWAPLKTRGIV